MKQKLVFFLIGIFTLSISCQNQKAKKDTDQKSGSEVVVEEIHEVMPEFGLRTISDLQSVFEMADVGYYPEITNEPTYALNYKGEEKIAANMGVYMADLLYAMTTSGRKDAYADYGAIMELSKHIGLTNEFPALIIERYEKSTVSIDSIVIMLDHAFENSEKKLSDIDKSEFYEFMLLGNYIEKLYLVSSIIQRPKKTELPEEVEASLKRNLVGLISKQSNRLEELLKIMSKYSNVSNNVLVLDELIELKNAYMIVEAKRDEIMKLGPTEFYGAKEILNVHEKIAKIRSRIVK
jgi:hypothetical protein